MTTEADRHLLTLIRAGDADGWSQFVARFEKRLTAFAVRRVDQPVTAQDLVQETFIGFLKSMDGYREQCSLESFLFQILRRRIVDHYRATGQSKLVRACDVAGDDSASALDAVPAREMQASWYARRDEQNDADAAALTTAIVTLAGELHDRQKFRDLKVAEGLFYAGMRNRELASAIDVSENEIAVVKHRLVKRLSELMRADSTQSSAGQPIDVQLRSVWELQRPGCPKRSTLGKYSLEILPSEWHDFIDFHVVTLRCTFCLANLSELTAVNEDHTRPESPSQLFHSTIGFLPKPSTPRRS